MQNLPDMTLTSTALRAIAEKLEQLEKMGIEVTSFKVYGLEVTVGSRSDQRDGVLMWVRDIRPIGKPVPQTNMRSTS